MSDYKTCMTQKMSSGVLKGKPKEERALEFCAMAKECSKGVSHGEAIKICEAMPPKEPKPRKSRKQVETVECPPTVNIPKMVARCEIQLGKLAGSGELSTSVDYKTLCETLINDG